MSSGKEKMKKYEEALKKTAIPTTRVNGSGKVDIKGIGRVHISGSGFLSPEEIRISGSGHLPGGIKVGKLGCSGSVAVDGDIEAEEMRFSGSASIAGNLKAKSLSASGSISIGGKTRGSMMRFSGSCKMLGGVELEDTLQAHGAIRVYGDVKAQRRVELHGRFIIDGKIITKDFEAELARRESRVRNGIEAVNVEIRKRGVEGLVIFGIPFFGFISRRGFLTTSSIKAKERVFIENVSCNDVYGKDVFIGEGCTIKGKVLYSREVSVHPKAKLASPPEKIEGESGL